MEKPVLQTLAVHWLGMVEYSTAWSLQDRLAGEIAAGKRQPTLLLLEHPPTFTLGRRASEANLLWDEEQRRQRDIAVHWVDRGGDITYHGPGQLVGYPLLPLGKVNEAAGRLPQADFVDYVRRLELALIATLAYWGIPARQRAGLTGVWVEERKIASIGVKVDVNGISRHGFALNVAPLSSDWQGIIPCGLHGVQMAAMADYLTGVPALEEVGRCAAKELAVRSGFQLEFCAGLSTE